MRATLPALVILAILAASAAAQNALKNPGFEEPTVASGSSIGKWLRVSSMVSANSSESENMPHGGFRHIALTIFGRFQFAGVLQTLENPFLPGAILPVVPGELVSFRGWHKAEGFASNQTTEIKLEWRGAPNPPPNRVDIINVPVGEYSRFVHTGVAPAGTTGVQVSYFITSFEVGQGSQTLVYIDDFQVLTARLPGDYNNNGQVDAADYVVWRNSVGTTTPLTNDLVGGTIGAAQYDAWKANFGSAIGRGASAAIPETASGTLIVLAALGHLAIRGRAGRMVTKRHEKARKGLNRRGRQDRQDSLRRRREVAPL